MFWYFVPDVSQAPDAQAGPAAPDTKLRSHGRRVGLAHAPIAVFGTLLSHTGKFPRKPIRRLGRYAKAPMRSLFRHDLPRLSLLVLLAGLTGCASPAPIQPPLDQTPPATTAPELSETKPFFSQTGIASFYGAAHEGKTRADGGAFDPDALTAAHLTLAFGTVVRVTNLRNGKTVKVAINDRGPHGHGRVIDLSAAAARALGMEAKGIARVRLDAFRDDQSAD